jgi:hypothetical protein
MRLFLTASRRDRLAPEGLQFGHAFHVHLNFMQTDVDAGAYDVSVSPGLKSESSQMHNLCDIPMHLGSQSRLQEFDNQPVMDV